jgi:membrane protein implicated in regulation of membrane protease activity
MTTAQVIFSIALGVAALTILAFAVFVVSTTMWGDRWVRVAKKPDEDRMDER